MGLISRAWTNLAPPGAISPAADLTRPGVSRPDRSNSWPTMAFVKLAPIRIRLGVNEPAP